MGEYLGVRNGAGKQNSIQTRVEGLGLRVRTREWGSEPREQYRVLQGS